MSPEVSTTKLCPTCGTRLSENATRCLVCGTELTPSAEAKKPKTVVQGTRIPEITLSLPAALGMLALFLTVGAGLVFFGLRSIGGAALPTPAPTPTETATVTVTPTETLVPTLAPTATLLPPIEYTVATGDTCSSVALFFNVSVQSIIIQNNLPAACNTLRVGQKLLVPQPTPTVTAAPTATLEPAAATAAACDKVTYTVQANDTLSSIAANYAVPQESIKEFNGLATDTVFLGMNLLIPLCRRAATAGPSPTPTIPPPYPAPNLLLPPDGASFTLANNNVTLQWASIGTLRDNEAYQVVVEDVTEGQGRKIIEYVTDTKFIVPASFRPNDNVPHVFRWWVTTVRQTSTDEQGQPVYTSAGTQSMQRVFSWQGVTPQGTPTP
jgi:LysM repeat protein/ribosomal protein L40E